MKRIVYVSIGLFLAIFIAVLGIKSTQDILKEEHPSETNASTSESGDQPITTATTTDIWDYINGKQTAAVTTAPLLDANGNVVTDSYGVMVNEIYANVVVDADGKPVTDEQGKFVTDCFIVYTTDKAGHLGTTNLGVLQTDANGKPALDENGNEQYTMPAGLITTTTATPLMTMPPVTTSLIFTIFIN